MVGSTELDKQGYMTKASTVNKTMRNGELMLADLPIEDEDQQNMHDPYYEEEDQNTHYTMQEARFKPPTAALARQIEVERQ